MRRVRGLLAGYLGLVALSALLSEGGAAKTSGLFGWLSTVVDRALSPGVPAIPDYAGAGAGGAAGGSSSSGLAPKDVTLLPKGTPPSTAPATPPLRTRGPQ